MRKSFHTKDGVVDVDLSLSEVEDLYLRTGDRECKIEILRVRYGSAVGINEKIDLVAQAVDLMDFVV